MTLILLSVSMRLKSVSNIAKITKSMKMIASTKVARAQKGMETARAFGSSFASVFEHAGTAVKEDAKNPLLITVSSDRGLCGGIHSSVSKATKKSLSKVMAQGQQPSLVVLGQ
jgi:F-type H+-transporting ATPase subunit gamma